jgi:NADH-quinone oxidoreductase subunit M
LFLVLENFLKKWLFFNLRLLKFRLIFCFCLNEFILFFFFFELSLIPTAYLIFSWGVQPERVSARFYFLLYALIGSFPLLANLIYLSSFLGEFNFSLNFKKKNYYFFVFKKKRLVTIF